MQQAPTKEDITTLKRLVAQQCEDVISRAARMSWIDMQGKTTMQKFIDIAGPDYERITKPA